MYKLFTDKTELFECSISLQGASLKKSKARGYEGKKKRIGFRNYRDFYNPETKRKVKEIRAMEINAHNYKF